MIGRSGSPSRKLTITSWPIRGIWIEPQFFPAQACETRIQQELFSLDWSWRSQWKCTLTRPYWSVQISSPLGPTTTAVCGPRTTGTGVDGKGRKAWPASIQSSSLSNCAPPPPLPVS